jgi:hypothetical protein
VSPKAKMESYMLFSTPRVKLAWHELVEAVKIHISASLDKSGYVSQWSSLESLDERQKEFENASIAAARSSAEQILALRHVWMKEAHIELAVAKALGDDPEHLDYLVEKVISAEDQFIDELNSIHSAAKKVQTKWRLRMRKNLRIRIPPHFDDDVGSGEAAPKVF